MADKTPLLENANKNQENKLYRTRVKIMCYVMLNSIGILISSSGQTKFIYSYVKANAMQNVTRNSTNYAPPDLHPRPACHRDDSVDESEIQSQTSYWNWIITATQYGLALPIIVCVGPMIDSNGRKPLLLWNIVGTFFAIVLKTLVAYYKLHLGYFIICAVLDGLSGTYFTFHLVCLSILADITSKGNQRTMTLAVYRAMMAIGGFIAYVGMGYLSEIGGFPYPFAVSSVIFLSFVIIVSVSFQDTWKPNSNRKLERLNSSVEIFLLCKEKLHVKRNIRYLILYYGIFTVYMLPMSAKDSVKTIFLLGSPFCWHPKHFGWYSAMSGLIIYLCSPFILKILHKLFRRIRDEVILVLGLFSAAATLFLFGFSNNDASVYAATAAGLFKGLPITLIKAILSRSVNSKKQGTLFSNIYLIEASCALIGTTIFDNIYHQTVTVYKGTVFFVMALFPILAIVLVVFTSYNTKIPKERIEIIINRSK